MLIYGILFSMFKFNNIKNDMYECLCILLKVNYFIVV